MSLANINLKLLNTFLLVAEFKSIRGAAEKSHRSESAVSMQIRTLEEQLGLRLFERTTRNIALTVEGKHLFGATQRGLAEINRGLREMQEAADLRLGHVNIGASPIIAQRFLPQILLSMQKEFPKVTVSLTESPIRHLVLLVRERVVDFGIGTSVPGEQDLDFETILHEPNVAVLPAAVGKDFGGSISLEEFARFPLISMGRNMPLMEQMAVAFEARKLPFEPKYVTSETQTVIEFVAAGLGVGMLGKIAVPINDPRIVSMPIRDAEFYRKVALITPGSAPLSPAALRLAQLTKRIIKEASGHDTTAKAPG